MVNSLLKTPESNLSVIYLRRVQHLSNEFWNQWRKEVLLTLQNCEKGNNQGRNYKIGDAVLLKEDSERNRWPIAKIVAVNSDAKEDVCSVRIQVGAADKSDNLIHYLERPVNKLVVLVENEDGHN